MTTTLADLPGWGLVMVLGAIAVAVMTLLGRRRHDQGRAAAFRTAAEEAKT